MTRRILKQALLFMLSLGTQITNAASPALLTNYAQLSQALTNGNEVRAIIALQYCTDSKQQPVKNELVGGLNFTQFNQYFLPDQQKNTISTSYNILVKSPKFGHVYNYVRLRIFENNSAELLSEMIDPKNFNSLHSTSYHCHLKTGEEVAGVSLYELG